MDVWFTRHATDASAVHRAAGTWCEEHGLADGAVHHAVDAGGAARAAGLTSRELEVLTLLAAGTPNQAIVRELVISLDTAKKAREPVPSARRPVRH